jgi:hypothetical protein
LNYLLTRTEIDKNKIGLIGHSEGGMIAPMVASHRKEISFIIMLAGPGIKIIDLMAEQNAAVLQSSGVDEQTVSKFIPLYKNVAMAIVQGKDSASTKRKASKIMVTWNKQTDAKTKTILGWPIKKARKVMSMECTRHYRAPGSGIFCYLIRNLIFSS